MTLSHAAHIASLAGVYLLILYAGYGMARVLIGPGCERMLALFLAPGIGFFTAQAVLYAGLEAFGTLRLWPVLVSAAATVFLTRAAPDARPDRTAVLAVFGVLAFAAAIVVVGLLKSPFGAGLDVWSVWHLKAAMIYRGGPDWKNVFSPVLDYSHPDYPLFYPLALVPGFLAYGGETPACSWAVALIFTLSLTGLLMAALLPRGVRHAACGGVFLSATPHILRMGGSQYADILVAYFFLGSVVLMERALARRSPRLAAAAGIFLGFNTFVKNEGIGLLAAGLGAFVLYYVVRRKKETLDPSLVYGVLAGLVPAAAVTLAFKLAHPYPNHMVSFHSFAARVASGEFVPRVLRILRFAAGEALRENAWVYGWVFCGLSALFFTAHFTRGARLWILLTLLFACSVYSGVYVGTTLELGMHLATSLDRLLVHLFPAALYLSYGAAFLKIET